MFQKFLILFALCFIPIMLSCGNLSNTDKDIVSINSQTSPCGGFKTLAKRSAGNLLPEDTISCKEETLFWRYDITSGILTLIHRCIHANCSAQLTMHVVRAGNTLTAVQSDNSDPNGGAACDCTFDLYCQVPDITGQTITLALDTFTFTLPLTDQKGEFILHPLENLSLHDDKHSDLSFLSTYPQLKSLQDVNIAAYSDLSPIGHLSQLRYFSGFNIDSISFLVPCTNLEYLDINAKQNLSDISTLQIFKNLSSLSIFGASLLQDISPIGYCTNLTSLYLTRCHNIANINSLSNCASLTTLTLSGCRNVTDIATLSGLTKLKELTLDSLSSVSSLAPLGSLTKLENLTITNNSSITDISALSSMTSLKSLVLTNMTAITDFTPLLTCLDSGDAFVYPGTSVPQNILDQLRQKGVAYKGGLNGK